MKNYFVIFFVAAFMVRAAVFYFFIQHEERYCQPDTTSYTAPAQALHYNLGMSTPDGRPVFWRTPGYPLFLAPFFSFSDNASWNFSSHETAYKIALWVQILFCSLLPIFLYILTIILTQSRTLAALLAWIGVFHPGFILASTFLLTDGPAHIFFILFLIMLFKSIKSTQHQYRYLTGGALALSIYTWMRPMGQFVAIAAIIVIFFSHVSLQKKIKQSLFFIILFFITLSPWFIRNYRLTEKIFFCPLFGLYFNVFNAPKIRARVENIPHELAWKKQCSEAEQEVAKEYYRKQITGDCRVPVNEMICMKPALPWMLNYPHFFIYDWITEVIKTTFDLYSYQFVSLYNNTFKWDPLVEYLPEKIAETLYKKELPLPLRILAYLELLFEIGIWLGIVLSLYMLFNKKFRNNYGNVILSCIILIGAVVGQTGGFGYARLRLPVEPLIIILGLIFWAYIYNESRHKNGIFVRTMAK